MMSMTVALALAASSAAYEVEGHRGARWARPENILSAFRYALEAGVDTLELDLHATKDDVLVITHDPQLNPDLCLDSRGRRLEGRTLVRSLTLAELKGFDCGSLVNPRFPEQVPQPKELIPTFEELLRWLEEDPDPRARSVALNVETKSDPAHPGHAPAPEEFARMVLAAAKTHRLGKRLILQSFDFRTLIAAKKLDPGVTTSALIEDRPREPLARLARRVRADIVSPDHRWLKKADVEELHKAGVKVVPWTANTEADWRRLAELGVDGIITDNPKALLEFRSRR
jgi:glycerophosphoryl diester phosphodiesterase